jgi:hypothetical protein
MSVLRGSPDFWPTRLAGVDWLKTVLATWTEYGPKGEAANFVAVANSTIDLLEHTSPALFRGAVIWCQGIGVQYNDELLVTIDGILTCHQSFKEMLDNWQIYDQGYANFLNVFDDVYFRYVMTLKSGLDYNSQFKLQYKETHGRTPAIYFLNLYAEIPA